MLLQAIGQTRQPVFAGQKRDYLDSIPMLTIIFSMAIREIIYVDDERLRQKAGAIQQFGPELAELAQDMLETMLANAGVGLAGPQIGVMQRIFVAYIPPRTDDNGQLIHPGAGQPYVLLNPEILACAPTLVEGEEGCLSIPQLRGLVARPEWVEVRAWSLNGQPFSLKAEGLLARIFFHEMDHLDGVLYLDHITDENKIWRLQIEDTSAVNAESAPPAAKTEHPVPSPLN